MKNIHVLLISLLVISCTQPKYEYLGQEIMDGKVSEVGSTSYTPYLIWVQTPTETRRVILPYHYRNRWKVGDSCLLIIEKYKKVEDEK